MDITTQLLQNIASTSFNMKGNNRELEKAGELMEHVVMVDIRRMAVNDSGRLIPQLIPESYGTEMESLNTGSEAFGIHLFLVLERLINLYYIPTSFFLFFLLSNVYNMPGRFICSS